MYRIRSTGELKTRKEIKLMFKNTSLPKSWSQDTLDFLDIDAVLDSPKPTITELQKVVLDGATQDGLGNWVKNWVIQDIFSEYVDENGDTITKEQQEQDFIASKLDSIKSRTLAELETMLDEKWTIIKNGYPAYETATFPFQVEEAKAYQIDSNADTTFIDIARGGASKSDYCALVLSNNSAYRAAGGSIVALRRTIEAQIESCETEQDYENIREVIKNA